MKTAFLGEGKSMSGCMYIKTIQEYPERVGFTPNLAKPEMEKRSWKTKGLLIRPLSEIICGE